MEQLAYIIVALLIGAGIGFGVNFLMKGKAISDANEEASRKIEDAQKKAANIISDVQLEAKEIIFAAKAQSDAESKERLKEVSAIEKRIHQREELIDNKLTQFDKRDQEIKKNEQSIADKTRNLEAMKAEVESLKNQQVQKLEEISGMDSKQAKEALMQSLESEARHEAAKLLKQIQDEAEAEADNGAKRILFFVNETETTETVRARR